MSSPGMRFARAARKPAEKGLVETKGGEKFGIRNQNEGKERRPAIINLSRMVKLKNIINLFESSNHK